MRIKIKADPKRDFETMTIEDGATLEEAVSKVMQTNELEYDILLGRVNGEDRELTYSPAEGDKVELLDMRTYSANLTYQRSLTLMYLAAAHRLFKSKDLQGVRIQVNNSLDKGFFTKLFLDDKASEEGRAYVEKGMPQEDVEAIQRLMEKMVSDDVPIEKEGRDYRIYDYTNYFYGPMVPSAGYVKYFEVRKYRKGVLLRFPYYTRPDTVPEYQDDYMLYEAFGDEYNWMKQLGIQYLSELNELTRNGGARELALLCEALHEKKISEIADKIKESGRRIILIAGPSSSGKTTFARRLCIQLKVNGLDPLYLGTDDYFVEREDSPVDENGDKDYENLDALDINLFSHDMNSLLRGEAVDIPEFDFISGHKIFGRRITSIEADQPIVIEGIHALNDKLTEQIDDNEKFRIYISPLTQLNLDVHNFVHTTDARMIRRMVRDYKYRGRSAAGTILQWPKVRSGEDKNIFPYNSRADVLFNSSLPYETGVLKKYAMPLLEEIGREDPAYSEAQRLLEWIKNFEVIEDENCVLNNSILREFIGGSVFES